MKNTVEELSQEAYLKSHRLMDECRRLGQEGYPLEGWALDLIERVERQGGKDVGAIFRKAYADEAAYGGRYFVAGVYMPLLLSGK